MPKFNVPVVAAFAAVIIMCLFGYVVGIERGRVIADKWWRERAELEATKVPLKGGCTIKIDKDGSMKWSAD